MDLEGSGQQLVLIIIYLIQSMVILFQESIAFKTEELDFDH